MQKWKINDGSGNEAALIEAEDALGAALKALEMCGWSMSFVDDGDDEHPDMVEVDVDRTEIRRMTFEVCSELGLDNARDEAVRRASDSDYAGAKVVDVYYDAVDFRDVEAP
jgi:hypothetical protein